jgi:hypothetical protein
MNTKALLILAFLTFACVLGIATPAPLAGQAGAQKGQRPPAPLPTTGQGKLLVFADLALFGNPTDPENCFLRNRFKRGESVGFRVTAVDGGSGNPETSAKVTVHVTYNGKTLDVPAEPRMLGGPKPYYPNVWTARWLVPKDAPTGIIRYTVTASDKYGRTGEWKPFTAEPSQLTIVQ